LVIGGHVDRGKSTVIGRLLADLGALPEETLDQIRDRCARTSRRIEYAFLLDALKDEQSPGYYHRGCARPLQDGRTTTSFSTQTREYRTASSALL
jgi:translation elongation factor EF-1alpha